LSKLSSLPMSDLLVGGNLIILQCKIQGLNLSQSTTMSTIILRLQKLMIAMNIELWHHEAILFMRRIKITCRTAMFRGSTMGSA